MNRLSLLLQEGVFIKSHPDMLQHEETQLLLVSLIMLNGENQQAELHGEKHSSE